jgi:hypothetical protein
VSFFDWLGKIFSAKIFVDNKKRMPLLGGKKKFGPLDTILGWVSKN